MYLLAQDIEGGMAYIAAHYIVLIIVAESTQGEPAVHRFHFLVIAGSRHVVISNQVRESHGSVDHLLVFVVPAALDVIHHEMTLAILKCYT